MKTFVVVTTTVAGTHQWTGGYPTFLGSEHRHNFHVRVEMEVMHDDRELEIILLKNDVNSYFLVYPVHGETKERVFGGRSCEMLAEDLLSYLRDKYKLQETSGLATRERDISVEVLEDGELGGKVSFRSDNA